MSVLVKGMEMPKSCWDCPCHNAEFVYCQADKQERGLPIDKDKPDWCPLVPVPPHGRLIDADACERKAYERLLMCEKYDNRFQKPYEVMRAIALAPTIPAEEGE